MDKPYDYSEDTIKAIVDRDEEVLAEEDNDSEKPNIIMLQLETFFDPTTVEFLEFSEDPIPNFRRLMEEYSSGDVYKRQGSVRGASEGRSSMGGMVFPVWKAGASCAVPEQERLL